MPARRYHEETDARVGGTGVGGELDENVKVAVFGETLVDEFPDRSVLGGAPFNVAYHLKHLGLEPVLVTRVGRDEYGERLWNAIRTAGMDTRGVQRDPVLPTGRVRVTFDDGGHRFEILENQAYDAIDCFHAAAAVRAAQPRLVYFGTLAQRSERSRAALDATLNATHSFCWLDINLRAPFDGKDVILRSLEMADDLKLNDDELGIVAGRLDLPGTDPELHVAELIKRFDLRCVTVTCGARGAWSLDVDGNHARVEGRPLDGPLVDTVGAGDGFAAVSIAGFIRDWTPQQTLERADAFARRLCLIRGAIPDEEWTGFQDLQD